MRVKNKNMVLFGVFWLVVAVVIFVYFLPPKEVHDHADFAVYLDGTRYNFFQPKYLSDENKTLSEYTHLHDMNGDVIHKHAAGVTLGYFFGSLGIRFNSTCFVLDDETDYCNDGAKELLMFVNGERNTRFGSYEFRDLDRILIAYGNYSSEQIGPMIASVTNEACIQSLKCPERGSPFPESCTGGICEE